MHWMNACEQSPHDTAVRRNVMRGGVTKVTKRYKNGHCVVCIEGFTPRAAALCEREGFDDWEPLLVQS